MSYKKAKFDNYADEQKLDIIDASMVESCFSPSYCFIKVYAKVVTIILLFVLVSIWILI